MFTGIKPPGAYPVSGTTAHGGITPSNHTDRAVRQQKNFDQFELTTQIDSQEAMVQTSVSRIIRQVRTRPTHADLAELKKQIADGTYQPDVKEIAARMLMTEYQED